MTGWIRQGLWIVVNECFGNSAYDYQTFDDNIALVRVNRALVSDELTELLSTLEYHYQQGTAPLTRFSIEPSNDEGELILSFRLR